MNRVGILTFQFAHNYGALLQAYALKETLTNEDTLAELINYRPEGLWENYSLNPIYPMKKHQLRKLLLTAKRIKQAHKFSTFQKRRLQLDIPIYRLNNESIRKYDIVIVGSDQVWSDSILPDTSPYFFEDFDGAVKMSYAASFGTNELTENIRKKIKKNLPEFSVITVREQRSIKMIQDLLPGCKVEHVCDPVFLLSASDWRKLYKKCPYKLPDEKYILYVDLRNDRDLAEQAKSLRKTTGYEVIYIHPTCWKTIEKSFLQLYDVGPLEYLSLVDHAEYIVTNSFHAVAFSLIFRKKIVHLADSRLGSRVMDLLDTFSLQIKNRFIDCSEVNISQSVFVNNSKRIIQSMKKRAAKEAN